MTQAEQRAKKRAYYLANRERMLEQNREWCRANPEKRRATRNASAAKHRAAITEKNRAYHAARPGLNAIYTARWREKNRDRHREMIREWAARNVERRQASAALRRALMVGGDVTEDQWRAIKRVHDHSCLYCGAEGVLLTMDHVVALSRGGAHHASNIVPACIPCNSSKRHRDVDEWLAWRFLR